MAYQRQQQVKPFSCGAVEIYQEQSLGVGAYGKVCKARCGQLLCAAKMLHETLLQHHDPGEQVLISKFERECQLLSTIQHPNIVQYLGTARDATGRAALLMELMDESLTKYLERSVTPLPCHIQVDICHDVALALAYLHSNDVMHRDLSSNNVLLIAGRRAKVTDFGMAKLVDDYPSMMTPQHTQVPGSQHYMPPEALLTPPRYGKKLDCFSYGVLTLQIASGNPPTPGDAMRREKRNDGGFMVIFVPESERREEDIALVGTGNPLYPIALNCIKDDETTRPSVDEIYESVAKLKKQVPYRNSLDAGTGNATKYQAELRTVHQENLELKKKIMALEKKAREADGKLEMARQEADMSELAKRTKLVKRLEGKNQDLADLHKRLAESEERARVDQEYRRRVEQIVRDQQAALGYKDQQIHSLQEKVHHLQKKVHHLQKTVKDHEAIVSQFQVMDINQRQKEAFHQLEVRCQCNGIEIQGSCH
jgi:serine/threonine protein kinase